MDILGLFSIFFSFIESFVFEQHALFRADFLSVTSNLKVYDPGCGYMSKSSIPLNSAILFLSLNVQLSYQQFIRKHSHHLDN